MPRLGSIKRKDLIRFLRKAGFEGLYSGRNHQFMMKGDLSLRILNPHQSDISKGLLVRILKQAEIEKEGWEAL